MEISGSTYLYAIASLSMAFVSFSVIVVVFRQMMGAEMSKFHLLLVRLFIESGLLTVMLALLPSLLLLLGFESPQLWKIASGIGAITLIVYLITYIIRRRKVKSGRVPMRIYVNYVISFITLSGLCFNVIGWPYKPFIGPYVLALSWSLFMGFIVFLETLNIFFEGHVVEN